MGPIIMRIQAQTRQRFENVMTFTVILFGLLFIMMQAAHAAANSSDRSLKQALAATESASLYKNHNSSPFSLSSSYFSGRASGRDISSPFELNDPLNYSAELENDQRVYALLIDGSYDFNYDNESTGLRPYINGGVGMAVYGRSYGAGLTSSATGDVVPLFRLGGGVTYRLDPKWNLSLDYKAGFSAASVGDQVFTGRGQESVDMQMLNMGMRYQF